MKKLVSVFLCLVLLAIGLTALTEGGWTCSSCGTENQANHNFCRHCGAPRDTSWTCPACDNVNTDNFCTNCGQPKPNADASGEAAKLSAEELFKEGQAAYDEQDYETALKYLHPAADQGNGSAQFYMGLMYRNGYGVEQDFAKAVAYYSLAADQGSASAQNNLGVMYYNGEGVEQDYEKAAEYFQLGADNGDQYAPNNLKLVQEKIAAMPETESLSAEELYKKGQAAYGKEDYDTALKYFQPVADQGYSDAQYYLGLMYNYGEGVEQDYEKAAEYFQLASDKGNEYAMGMLGEMYENGNGVEKDYNKALEYYQLALDGGNGFIAIDMKKLQKMLAATPVSASEIESLSAEELYEKGDAAYREMDYVTAFNYLEPAADRGSADAMFRLGYMYLQGDGVQQSGEKALECYEKSGELGKTEAYYYAGYYCEKGDYGIEQDYGKAVEYYQLAAERGSVSAQYNLGLMYDEGRGVEQDYEKAVEYYRLAADQGIYDALYNLVQIYINSYGDGKDNVDVNYYLGKMYLDYANKEMDPEKGIEYYELAADQGHLGAQLDLGQIYDSGIRGVKRDAEKAAKYYLLAAGQGDAYAQFRLGAMYYSGRDALEQDYEKAYEFFHLAADQGYAIAQLRLGYMYLQGIYVEQDDEKALEFFLLSEKNGDEDAAGAVELIQRKRAAASEAKSLSFEELCEKGKAAYDEKDYEVALEYLLPAAEQGDAIAQISLGVMYLFGNGVKKDFELGLKYYQLAADQGQAVALFDLGRAYYDGEFGLEQNYEKAAEYYQLALDNGLDAAVIYLEEAVGKLYEKGKAAYHEQDYETALQYLQPAADQGNSGAQFYMGLMYRNGYGVEQDFAKAMAYYTLAAGQGYASAQNNLGVMYEDGLGVEQNLEKAAEYYRSAVDNGSEKASENLKRVQEMLAATPEPESLSAEELEKKGFAFMTGQGEEKSDEKAVEYFRLSAEKGYSYGQYYLGIMYSLGRGVDQDYKKAAEYYQLASDQGNHFAQVALGGLYENGRGVERDYKKALEYYQLAVENGKGFDYEKHVERIKEKMAGKSESKPATDNNGGDSGGSSWDSSSSSSVKTLCWKCHGNKEIECTQCNGSGGKWVYSQVPNYSGSTSPNNTAKNWEKCFKCGGSGKITCPNCGGSGYT